MQVQFRGQSDVSDEISTENVLFCVALQVTGTKDYIISQARVEHWENTSRWLRPQSRSLLDLQITILYILSSLKYACVAQSNKLGLTHIEQQAMSGCKGGACV